MFIICLDYVSQTSIDTIKEKTARNRRHPTEITIFTDYADDLALLANAPAKAES